MTTSICILSMHSAGSSLVSSILDALGVNMHYNPRAKVRWYQNYEDADFVRFNVQIIKKCGADWKNPPKRIQIQTLKSCGTFDDKIKTLLSKRKGLWGFKDPRTAITIPLIHPFLDNPHYIRVVRSHSDIAKSLMKRGGKSKKSRWIELSKKYNMHIDAFLTNKDVPLLNVQFSDLLNQKKSRQSVQSIAAFVGSKKIDQALKRINYARK